MTTKNIRSIRALRQLRHKQTLDGAPQEKAFNIKATLVAFAVSGLMAGIALLVVSQPVSAAACSAPASDLGTDSITITVPADATYTVWTRMIAPDATHNAINLQVDTTDCYSVGGGAFAAAAFANDSSNWVNYANGTASTPIAMPLTAGDHTFKYIGTQAGVGVDKILITSNSACVPTGVGDNCPSATSTPPTVNLLTPAANATVTGPLDITATAVGTGGATISSVAFLVDNQVVNTDTASPFSYSWNSASVANGTHTVSAQATDTAGATATTTPVTITVNNASTCTGTPSIPTGLTVTGTTSSSVSLSWGASTPASNCTLKEYKIYRDGNLITSVASGTTYQETGLAPGGTYSYTVAAADTTGHISGQSTAVTASTVTDAQPPTAPMNVHSTLLSGTSAALAWDASTDNSAISGYTVYRATGAVTTGIDTVVGNPTGTSFTDTGLTPNTQYTYVVKGKDTAGNLSTGSTPYTITTTDTGNTGGTDKIYLTPDSGTFLVGSNITVQVREDSGADMVNAVQADLKYSANNLQFVKADATGSGFGVEASDPNTSAGNGVVSIPRGNTSPISGDKLISTVTFKVIATGTATVEVSTSSVLLSSDTNADIASQRLGAGYTLTNTPPPSPPPVVPPTPPTPPPATPPASNPPTPPPVSRPNPSPTPPSTTRPVTGSTGSTTTTKTTTPTTSSTTIAPTGNSNPLPLTSGTAVELSDPAVVQTSSDSSASIKKVEYILNGKTVFVATTPPYSYKVNTTGLRNGRYTLTTKTTYDSGKVDSSNSQIIVNNPMNLTQIMLQLKHYAWVLILLALIAGGAIWFMFFRGNGGDEFGDTDVSGGFGVPGMYDDPNGGTSMGGTDGAGGQITPTLPPNMAPTGNPLDMNGSLPPGLGGAPPPPPGVPGQGPDPYGRY